VLVDTGPIVALLSDRDADHKLCADVADRLTGVTFTCWPVVTEAAWLLRNLDGGVASLIRYLDLKLIQLLELDSEAVPRIGEIVRRYDSLGVQLADAALVYLSEREGIDTVFTLDYRDFSVLRKRDGRPLRIIPAIG
jgi:predicted nucleic acid-binding protein